jgi:chemotaxis protein methyltransferase CheR
VTFTYLNLAEDLYPSLLNNTNAMDLILCRNVLMYFAPEQTAKVVGHFHSALVDGGWLVVSSAETSSVLYRQFTPMSFSGITVYKKEIRTAPFQKTSFPKPALFVPPTAAAEPVQPSLSASRPEAKKPGLYEQALGLHESGQDAEAAEKLHELVSQDEKKTEAIELLARVYANLGRLPESMHWCDRAIHGNKLDAGLYFLRATILQEQGSFENSAATFKRALYLDPDFVLAHFALGNLALRQENQSEADKHFENALSLLGRQSPENILPGSEGITAGRLREIIRATLLQENAA